MLTKMRQGAAKIVTFILFALLIMSFAVWGIGDIFYTGGHGTVVAEVGNVQIDQRSFATNLNREVNRLRRQVGSDIDMTQARALGLVDQVLERMISQALFSQQADRMGLVIGERQLQEEIIRQPAFQNDQGQFDRLRYDQVLRANGWNEAYYLQILTDDLLRSQLASALLESVAVPDAVTDALYAYDEERRVAETLFVPLGTRTDAEPTLEQLEGVLLANEVRFRTPEYRALRLIYLTREGFADDVEISEADLEAAFEQRRSAFDRPEQRSFQQVLFTDEASAQEAINLMMDGQDFAFASQSTSGQPPIELGPLSLEQLNQDLPALADVVFGLEEDQVSEAIQSPFGWHLIRVTSIEPAYAAALEDVREALDRELALEASTDILVSEANRLDDELAAGIPLDETAQNLGFELITVAAVDAQGRDPEGRTVGNLPPLNQLLPIMLRTQPGETSLLEETADGDFFVLSVDSVTPAEPKPLEEVRDELIEIWRDEQRQAVTRERAEQIAELARGGQSFSDLAAAENLTRGETEPIGRDRRGLTSGVSPQLVSALFNLKADEIAVVDTQGGAFVAKLVEVRGPESADQATLDGLKAELGQAIEGDILAGFVQSLRGEIGVEIDQQLIEDTMALQ